MNIFVDLKAALLAIPAVSAIVGSVSEAARIWNSWERVNAYPCLIMDVDREEENNDLTGKGELMTADVTITCRGETHDASDALQEAVRGGLAGYHGTFDAILDETVHSETPKGDGSTAHWYDHVMSFTFLWTEPVA